MKSNIFLKVIDEKILETQQDFGLVVNRLRLQEGICREKDSDGDRLQFTCSKKGKFMVSNIRNSNRSRRIDNDRMYFVRGKVVPEGAKTKIYIYTVKDCTITYSKWASLIGDIIWFFFSIFLMLFTDVSIDKKILVVSYVAMLLLSVFLSLSNQQDYREEDIKIMQNEVIKRVHALERWDD